MKDVAFALDPQTAGGLLISLPEQAAARFLDQMPGAVIIGLWVLEPDMTSIRGNVQPYSVHVAVALGAGNASRPTDIIPAGAESANRESTRSEFGDLVARSKSRVRLGGRG